MLRFYIKKTNFACFVFKGGKISSTIHNFRPAAIFPRNFTKFGKFGCPPPFPQATALYLFVDSSNLFVFEGDIVLEVNGQSVMKSQEVTDMLHDQMRRMTLSIVPLGKQKHINGKVRKLSHKPPVVGMLHQKTPPGGSRIKRARHIHDKVILTRLFIKNSIYMNFSISLSRKKFHYHKHIYIFLRRECSKHHVSSYCTNICIDSSRFTIRITTPNFQ